MTPDELAVIRALDSTKQELLAEVLRRCMGIDANDNARHDFGDINGGRLQRPTEVAAELLRALSDEGLTITPLAALAAEQQRRERVETALRRLDAIVRVEPRNAIGDAEFDDALTQSFTALHPTERPVWSAALVTDASEGEA